MSKLSETARERLGMRVRATWIAWAKEQPDIAEHPHWLTEWDQLAERDQEVDRRIGEDIAINAANDLALDNIRVAAQIHSADDLLSAIAALSNFVKERGYQFVIEMKDEELMVRIFSVERGWEVYYPSREAAYLTDAIHGAMKLCQLLPDAERYLKKEGNA